MFKLAGIDEKEQVETNLQKDLEIKEKREARKNYLEISLEQEKEELLKVKKKIDKEREAFIVSIILIVCAVLIFIYIGFHAMSIAVSFVSRPLWAILILGGIVKFISYTVKYSKNHIPMYIWCEQEKNGNSPIHDNYVREYRRKEHQCVQMENELRNLNTEQD